MEFPITKGMTVFLQPTGNNLRGWTGEPIQGTITKIGRKYFYVQKENIVWREYRFDLNTFVYDDSDSNAGYIVYPDEESFNRAQEYRKMLQRIRTYFGCWTNEPSYACVKKIFDFLVEDGQLQQKG